MLFGIYLNGEVPFLDLTERVKKSELDKGIVASRQKLFAWKDKTYGVAQSLSAMVLYYRTDLFEKYNLVPEDLATWDDFVRKGEELAAKHQAMFALDPTYYDALLRQRGSDWFGKDGKPFPDEVMAIDTLKWMVELKEKGIGIVPERASIYDPVFFSSSVSSGEVICLIGADCQTTYCSTSMTCSTSSCPDGQKNGGETDLDCGGNIDCSTKCGTGQACLQGTDCTSGICSGGFCS